MIRFTVSALTFAGSDWLLPSLIAGALGLALVAWGYFRSGGPHWLRLTGALLKSLAVVALALCALEPTWSGQRIKPGANIIAVVADDSASMQLQGEGEPQPRAEVARDILSGTKSSWRTKLSASFDLKNYTAGTGLQTISDFAATKFQDRTTGIGRALSNLRERFRGQPLAGIVLVTDGVATDLDDVTTAAAGLPPIYPVVIGAAAPARDLSLNSLSATQTAFEDAPVSMQSEVQARGMAGQEVVARLRLVGEPNKITAEQTLKPSKADEKLVFRFQIRPEKTGVLFYEVEVTPKDPASIKEAALANNRAIVSVDRGSEVQRILYVSGRPNWEYKFLQRSIQGDPQTHMIGLIRIAKREPKFEFRGRAGESSNPLFRGFGNQSPEEIARYDQPVLLWLNTEEGLALPTGFPKTAEELFPFRAIIIDDLESEFFTPDQMSLLQRFVSERGGTLMMLGGAESFADGAYARTAIGEMLPIYLDRKGESLAAGGQVNWNLSRDGWLQPWARLRKNEVDERARLSDTPGFDVVNSTGNVKPAASIVATVSNGSKEVPALVTQRFGRGRTAALMVGDLWQTGLGDEARQLDLQKQWRQMVRWLVADVPAPLTVTAETEPNSPDIRLQVQARDKRFEPRENATVNLTVQPSGLNGQVLPEVKLVAEPSATTPGVYEAVYVPREDGGYRVEAAVTDEGGVDAGKAQAGWSTQSAAAEYRSLAPDRALMERIAAATGGKVLSPDELDRFAADLPSRPAPLNETWSRPLWHTPFVFLFALGCLVAEWGIRRWKGLP